MSDEQRTPSSNLDTCQFYRQAINSHRSLLVPPYTRIAKVQGANHLIAPLFLLFPNLVGASADESCGLHFYRSSCVASEPLITIHRLLTVQN
ncbi:hypothetical protein P692DRAFT_201793268 [Suillus brevipes Sb2]|nr:hypothetical protein P692DRAFT_201793268 [Suillus brevipes Sb2]